MSTLLYSRFLANMVRLAIILSLALWCCVGSAIVIKINQGSLAGEARKVSTGLGTFYSFRGIPYAEPPVGKLRFRAPIPHKGWTGIKNATQHGNQCLHQSVFMNSATQSEDCLFLNVYTPDLVPKKLQSVIVYFHGGGWKLGSGNDNLYGPDFLIVHDVILVTVNYRLDALGFLNLNTPDVPGNAGMKDQALALKWVHHNIHHFGGNENEITIMGQSAGGSSVIYHMMSPMSKGLFKKAITMSSVPFCDWALPFESEKRAFHLGNILGKNATNHQELLEFLQSVPATELVNRNAAVLSQEYIRNDPSELYFFVPVVEVDFGQKRFLTEPIQEALTKRHLADVDLMIGYTDKENTFLLPMIDKYFDNYRLFPEMLLPREILYKIPPQNVIPLTDKIHRRYFGNRQITRDTLPDLLRHKDDKIYIYNINRFLKYMPSRDSKIFLYKFFSLSERNWLKKISESYGIHGCGHTEDLGYLFSDLRPINVNSKEYRMINETCTLFTNFIKYGDPTPDSSLGVQWPQYDKINKRYMIINETLGTGANVDNEIFDWWSHIFESQGIDLP